MRAAAAILIASAGLCGCATAPKLPSLPFIGREAPAALTGRVSKDVELRLPQRPGYPQAQDIVQIIRANYGAQSGAFEASLSLSPERVDIVIAAPAGPRLATIHWTEQGVDQDRTLLAPIGVPVENILSDIFLLMWPREAVLAALPEGCEVADSEDGARVISCAGAPLIEISRDAADSNRRVLRNLDFGYELTIVDVS